MNYEAELSAFILANLNYIVIAIAAMIVLALIIFINLNYKLSRMNERYSKMMQGIEGGNLEHLLISQIEEVRQALQTVDALSRECEKLQTISQRCVQKVGVIRFNAFDDTGSDLSFAVAMLDSKNNGVVFSNIFGRNESRMYAKPIVGGESQYFLTEEEKDALAKARKESLRR